MILEIYLLEKGKWRSLRIPFAVTIRNLLPKGLSMTNIVQGLFSTCLQSNLKESWRNVREKMRRMRFSIRVGKGGGEDEVVRWGFERNEMILEFYKRFHIFLQLRSWSWSHKMNWFHDCDHKKWQTFYKSFNLAYFHDLDRSFSLEIRPNFERP